MRLLGNGIIHLQTMTTTWPLHASIYLSISIFCPWLQYSDPTLSWNQQSKYFRAAGPVSWLLHLCIYISVILWPLIGRVVVSRPMSVQFCWWLTFIFTFLQLLQYNLSKQWHWCVSFTFFVAFWLRSKCIIQSCLYERNIYYAQRVIRAAGSSISYFYLMHQNTLQWMHYSWSWYIIVH